jgi:hypothetical protein
MITVKEFMEIIDYKITEGSQYMWQCYGSNAYRLDSWNGSQDGHSVSIVFDTHTQEVYEVSAYDYRYNRAYRLINPDYKFAHDDEASGRGVDINQAWDDVNYVDLDVDDDFIQKALAIVAEEDYDTRVSVPVDFTDEELLTYMKMAHDRDITFNQLVEEALRAAIDDYKDGLVHVTGTADPVDFPKPKKKKKDKK